MSYSDEDLKAKAKPRTYKNAPAGKSHAVCIDMVLMEPKWSEKWKKETQQIRIVFQLEKRMELTEIDKKENRTQGQRYTHSEFLNFTLSGDSRLKFFLESWLGRKLTQQEIKDGFDLPTLIGKPATLYLVESENEKEPAKPYVNIQTIVAYDEEGRPAPVAENYIRIKDRVDESGNPVVAQQGPRTNSAGVGEAIAPDLLNGYRVRYNGLISAYRDIGRNIPQPPDSIWSNADKLGVLCDQVTLRYTSDKKEWDAKNAPAEEAFDPFGESGSESSEEEPFDPFAGEGAVDPAPAPSAVQQAAAYESDPEGEAAFDQTDEQVDAAKAAQAAPAVSDAETAGMDDQIKGVYAAAKAKGLDVSDFLTNPLPLATINELRTSGGKPAYSSISEIQAAAASNIVKKINNGDLTW